MGKTFIFVMLGLIVLVSALSGADAYIYYDNGPYNYGYGGYGAGYYAYQDYAPDYYYNTYSPWNNAAYYPTYSYNNPTKVVSFRDNPYNAYYYGDDNFYYDYHPQYGASLGFSAHGDDYEDFFNERQKYYFVRDTLIDYEAFRYDTYGERTGDVYGDDGGEVPDSNWRNKVVYDPSDYTERDYSRYYYGDVDVIKPKIEKESYTDNYYYKPRQNSDGFYNWRY